MFDAYFDGAVTRSSDAGSNFRQAKVADLLRFEYDSGVAQGSVVTWNVGITLDTSGQVGIGTNAPGAKLESVSSTGAQFRASHTTASKFLDITVGTDHNATFKPSSTGQIIFQPTTDSTDFLQVLDADGGTPVLNVDSVNERVGIGTATPAANLQVSGASSPFLLITDTTNPCSTVIQSQDAEGFFGTTTAHPLSFTTNGSRVMTLTTAGNVGIGLTAPQGILHTYDTIGGFLIWEYDGLDATVRTVVPNGAGDCLYRLQVTWVFRNSAGVVVSGSIGVSNGGSTSPTVGTDTVRIRVNADGSIDVARTAGTNTIKVLLHLLWL
jgi:hypothetical protein